MKLDVKDMESKRTENNMEGELKFYVCFCVTGPLEIKKTRVFFCLISGEFMS